MKRDARLHRLSSDHHHALVLARHAKLAAGEGPAAVAAAWSTVRSKFTAELAPHFDIEERLLLPALQAAGEAALVARTLSDHAMIRACLAESDAATLSRFADLLTEHIRFEERVLFEVAQERLPPAILDQIAAAH